MKRLILTLALMLGFAVAAQAQSYAVVNSEKIFKSIESYNAAITELDKLAGEYQEQVDEMFEQVEKFYNTYMERRNQLNAASQQANEEKILEMEKEATEFQESIFGTDGELMKKRLELIQPIQKKVFDTIESFATQYGYDLVIDISANPTVLYYSSKVDFTQKIINALR